MNRLRWMMDLSFGKPFHPEENSHATLNPGNFVCRRSKQANRGKDDDIDLKKGIAEAATASNLGNYFQNDQVNVPKGKTVKQEVAEERTINESVALTTFDDDRIRFFINETISRPKVKEALRLALEKRGQLAATQQQIADVQRELNPIKVDQPRLMSNLEKIPGTDPLAKRILEKLNKQETEIEHYEELVKKLNAKADEQRKLYEGYLAKLDIE